MGVPTWGNSDGAMGGEGGPTKANGKGFCSIKTLVDGIYSSGCLPGGINWANDENAVYIAGLPDDCTNLDLWKIFAPFGPIAPNGVRSMPGDEGKSCKGFAFVNFLDHTSAEAAVLVLNGVQLADGTALKVSIKSPACGGKGRSKTK